MESYREHELEAKVDAALQRIRTVLDNTKNPRSAADVPHRYDDKYLLAEVLTRVAAASLLQCLEVVGLNASHLSTMREWARTRSVTLRLAAHEDCGFLREESRQVESPHQHVTEVTGLPDGKIKRTDKIVTTVKEYFWGFDFEYEILAFQGTATDQGVTLHARKGGVTIKTGAKTTPRPRTVVRPPVDVNVTWLFTHLDPEGRAAFAIDRTHEACHTPRRNRDVDAALQAFEEVYAFCDRVIAYFFQDLFPAQEDHGRDLAAIDVEDVFVPVLPLFEENAGAEGVLPAAYADAFLAEERRSLAEKCRALAAAFPRDGTVITAVEAGLLVTLRHAAEVCRTYAGAVDHIEGMLRSQLVAAIGKVVTPADFNAYMEFHHRKLVAPPYRPKPFSYAIRRPGHDPEGVLAIEADRGGAAPDAISTTVASSVADRPMSFPLDASTRVSFRGERFLHAWIAHQFSGQPAPSLRLVARARQFSSYILLIGRIASADVLEPRFGVIVQNKDLVTIPLLLEQIPTPKEFRDAIASLSPEQQRFARAFRGMQLESTLFGVCVIQIKPQLEKLLQLPPDSLTKEIRMTQDLLGLFIEYQIPSDLLSYDGPPEAPTEEKLARVRTYVGKMQEMIALSKQREIEEEREREALRRAEMDRSMGITGGMSELPSPPMPRARTLMYSAASPSLVASARPPAAPPAGARPPPAPLAGAAPPARPAAAPQPPPPVAADPAPRDPALHPREAPAGPADGGEGVDYTRIPAALDRELEALDEDGAVRATILNPGDVWTRTAQKGLLGATTSTTLFTKEQKDEKNKAFDLLDALSKSGALSIEDASLHVVIAATHCFDRTLLDTVVQANVNPVEKVERTLMIVGTQIHGRPAAELLAEDQRERFFATSPRLGPAQEPWNDKPVETGRKSPEQ
jgi:hypothetical protein